MENILFTQLSVPEIRAIIREEVCSVLEKHNPTVSIEEDKDKLFTFKQACEYLSIASPTLYRYTSQSLIPHIKKGKKLYFLKVDILEWIKNGKKKTHDQSTQENYFLLKSKKIAK